MYIIYIYVYNRGTITIISEATYKIVMTPIIYYIL